MSDKRQKNQLVLAFTEEGRSEAPKASQEGTESLTAKCETERPASHEQLMEEVCERENCRQAYKRVKANKGRPGIDGMKVGELSGYLKQHWPSIREQLLRGTYQPQPVRRVEIPKPDGGVRKLDRKSTRLNSSHSQISYAVFCLKKKKKKNKKPNVHIHDHTPSRPLQQIAHA